MVCSLKCFSNVHISLNIHRHLSVKTIFHLLLLYFGLKFNVIFNTVEVDRNSREQIGNRSFDRSMENNEDVMSELGGQVLNIDHNSLQ